MQNATVSRERPKVISNKNNHQEKIAKTQRPLNTTLRLITISTLKSKPKALKVAVNYKSYTNIELLSRRPPRNRRISSLRKKCHKIEKHQPVGKGRTRVLFSLAMLLIRWGTKKMMTRMRIFWRMRIWWTICKIPSKMVIRIKLLKTNRTTSFPRRSTSLDPMKWKKSHIISSWLQRWTRTPKNLKQDRVVCLRINQPEVALLR